MVSWCQRILCTCIHHACLINIIQKTHTLLIYSKWMMSYEWNTTWMKSTQGFLEWIRLKRLCENVTNMQMRELRNSWIILNDTVTYEWIIRYAEYHHGLHKFVRIFFIFDFLITFVLHLIEEKMFWNSIKKLYL